MTNIVVTSADDLSSDGSINCALCGLRLATYDGTADQHSPRPERLLESGAVPVPNFGWFCSQDCADDYEARTGVRFRRNADGRVAYYS